MSGRNETDAAASVSSAPPIGSDRIFRVTRGVAIAIVPFLVAAVFLLFVFPTRTGELFAWPIDPPMTAYLLASAYVGGIWFFVGVAAARRWHRVKHGFPAVAVFSGALLWATLTHLDRFSANLSFWTWLVLYATTPFIVTALAIAQRREDLVLEAVAEGRDVHHHSELVCDGCSRSWGSARSCSGRRCSSRRRSRSTTGRGS